MNNRYVRVLGLNVIQFALLVVLFVGLGLKDYVDPTSNDLYRFGLAASVGSIAAIAITLLFYKFVDKKPLRHLKFTFNRKHALFSLISSLLIFSIYLIYCAMLAQNGAITAHFNRDYFSNAEVIPMFLVVGVSWFLAAFNEELTDRAYFVANFKDMGPGKIYLFSSLLFMISHVFKGLDPFYTSFLFLMGVVFMYIYIKTGSVLAASLPHFAFNFVTGQLVGNTDISILRVASGEISALHMGICSAIVMVTLLVLVRIFYRNKMTVTLKNWNDD